MTNPKIEKVNTAIAKTKVQIADYQAKLKELEKQKTLLENEEIVACSAGSSLMRTIWLN